jgi:hypothetical protein
MPARKVVPVVPDPARIRRIEGSFAWLDHRLLRDGHLERMTLQDLAVYVFLVLVADRTGTSFWRKDQVCRKLGIDWDEFEESKARLLERGLIAFRPFRTGDVDGFYQVLPIPAGGGR